MQVRSRARLQVECQVSGITSDRAEVVRSPATSCSRRSPRTSPHSRMTSRRYLGRWRICSSAARTSSRNSRVARWVTTTTPVGRCRLLSPLEVPDPRTLHKSLTRHESLQTILPPLNALLADITLPPALVLTLRDTQPSQNPELWLSAIAQLDEKIHAVRSRGKVRAAKEMESVIDGLRLKALTQLPPFLLSLIRPLRSPSTGLSTNLAVLQTSLLLKYQPFYAFLFRQSPRLAKQVERGYVNAARSYYETGMRRYARALGAIKARTTDKLDLIGVVSSDPAVMAKTQEGVKQAYDRLKYADLDEAEAGQVVLAYMTDDKDLVSGQRGVGTYAVMCGMWCC